MNSKQTAYEVPFDQPEFGAVRQVLGSLDARGLRVGIVSSRYNASFTTRLVEGAVSALLEHGASEEDVTVVWVPGAYEVSSAADRLARTGTVDAVIAIGVVIQGETTHAQLINQQVSQSLAAIARQQNLPVLDGVVPAENVAQAEARCQTGREGRGWYLGCAAIEMARVFQKLEASS